jgi:hypothetical protein
MIPISNFMKIRAVGTELFPFRRTDMTKLIVTFSNSANTSKNVTIIFAAVQFYGVKFQELSLERQRIRKKNNKLIG